MVMREGETLKTNSDRYWETFNEIDEDFEEVAIRMFKVGLPTKHELRKSLTKKLVQSMCQLMNRLINLNGSRMISNKGRGRQKWLSLIEEALGLKGVITTDPGEILLDILGFLMPKWSTQYSRSLCIRFLRR